MRLPASARRPQRKGPGERRGGAAGRHDAHKDAENAQQASQHAVDTRQVAERGGKVVGEAVSAMSRIEESSRKIADIIGVIDEIARQTNLLALNAAVEAARAGEAGRGFTVVATEVRSLAQRSSQAAKDIKDLITNSLGQVKEGVELVNSAGKALGEIVQSIKKVADTVASIANASAEQASGLDQVNKAITQMDEVTQQNAALVEENAATSKMLEQQAATMGERVSMFRVGNTASADEAVRVAPRAPAAPKPAAPVAPKSKAKAPVATSRPSAAPVKRVAAGGNGQLHAAAAKAAAADPEWKEF